MRGKEISGTNPYQEFSPRRGRYISPGKKGLPVMPGESPINPTGQVNAEKLVEELNSIAALGYSKKP